jgi:uncharacterized membrane protein YeaQ/YmgE (transglycosylase-associated protein family)
LNVINELGRKDLHMTQLIGFLAWMMIGALAGGLAGRVMKSGGGLPIDMGVGVVGALGAGFLLSVFGFAGTTGFVFWSVPIAFLAAFALVIAICLFNDRRRQLNGKSHLR